MHGSETWSHHRSRATHVCVMHMYSVVQIIPGRHAWKATEEDQLSLREFFLLTCSCGSHNGRTVWVSELPRHGRIWDA